MNENRYLDIKRRPHLTKEQRLPNCYKEVVKIVKSVKSCQINFKTVLAKSRLRGSQFKKVYKLSLNVLKYYNYIQKIIDKLQLLKKEKFLRKEVAVVLIYELIFGIGTLPGESKAVTTVRAYQNDLMTVHQELQDCNEDFGKLNEIYAPRYARVHTLVTTVASVIKDLQNYGFNQIFYNADLSEEEFYQLVKSLEKSNFLIDFHFKDMLVFSQAENLIDLDLYKNGHIFLQDKASYIPVHALNPEPGTTVLDACAAPGMKSAHIASKMKNKGILIACERDESRFETLKETLEYGSVKISRTLCTDFKLIDFNDEAYSAVDYILLDPSCSGSGMVNRMDDITDTENSKTKERLLKLAGFQIILLKHALKFPSVKRVVYSTCSVHEEENEYVVQEVLNAFGSSFKLVPVLSDSFDRGLESYEIGKMCLRTVAEKHLTNGFFVAMFERTEAHEHRRKKFSGKYSESESVKKSDDIFLEIADLDSKNLKMKTYVAQQSNNLDSLNMIYKTSERTQNYDQNTDDMIHLNFRKKKDFKTPEYSKHIKKEKICMTDIQFQSNEQDQEMSNINSALQEQCRNSEDSIKIETVDQGSEVSISEEKTKHKRHLISDNAFENFGMNSEISSDVKLKHKKRKKGAGNSSYIKQQCTDLDVLEQSADDYQSLNQDVTIIHDSFSQESKWQKVSSELPEFKKIDKKSKNKLKHNKQNQVENPKATFSELLQNSENSVKSISLPYSRNEVVDNKTNYKEQLSKNDSEVIENNEIFDDSTLKQKKKKSKKKHYLEEYSNIKSISLPFSGNEVVDNKANCKDLLSNNDSEVIGNYEILDDTNVKQKKKKSKKKHSLEENINIFTQETEHINEINSFQNKSEKMKSSKFKLACIKSNYLENNCLKEDKNPNTPLKEYKRYKKKSRNSDFTPSQLDSVLASDFVKSPSNLLNSSVMRSENSVYVPQNEMTEKQYLTDNYSRCQKGKKHVSKSNASACTIVSPDRNPNCASSVITNKETNQTVSLHTEEISINSSNEHHHVKKKRKKHEKDKEYDSLNFQFSNTNKLQSNQDYKKNFVQNDMQLIATSTENDCIERKKRKKPKKYLTDDMHFMGNTTEGKNVSVIGINPMDSFHSEIRHKNCKKHNTEIELHNIPLPETPEHILFNSSKKKKEKVIN